MRINTRESTLTLAGMALIAGVAMAITSNNFRLTNYLLSSSGGGKTESATYAMNVAFGENVIGNAESRNYKLNSGYVNNIVAGSEVSAVNNIENAYVYPNPYKPGSGGDFDADYLTFTELTEEATIEVFNIAGELVATIEKDSAGRRLQWEPANDAGNTLASGVYIFYISNNKGQKKKGKFAIVK